MNVVGSTSTLGRRRCKEPFTRRKSVRPTVERPHRVDQRPTADRHATVSRCGKTFLHLHSLPVADPAFIYSCRRKFSEFVRPQPSMRPQNFVAGTGYNLRYRWHRSIVVWGIPSPIAVAGSKGSQVRCRSGDWQKWWGKERRGQWLLRVAPCHNRIPKNQKMQPQSEKRNSCSFAGYGTEPPIEVTSKGRRTRHVSKGDQTTTAELKARCWPSPPAFSCYVVEKLVMVFFELDDRVKFLLYECVTARSQCTDNTRSKQIFKARIIQ